MMVRRKNLRIRQGSARRERGESGSEKCIKFEGEGLPLKRVDGSWSSISRRWRWWRERTRGCREADKNDRGEKEVTSERTGRWWTRTSIVSEKRGGGGGGGVLFRPAWGDLPLDSVMPRVRNRKVIVDVSPYSLLGPTRMLSYIDVAAQHIRHFLYVQIKVYLFICIYVIYICTFTYIIYRVR